MNKYAIFIKPIDDPGLPGRSPDYNMNQTMDNSLLIVADSEECLSSVLGEGGYFGGRRYSILESLFFPVYWQFISPKHISSYKDRVFLGILGPFSLALLNLCIDDPFYLRDFQLLDGTDVIQFLRSRYLRFPLFCLLVYPVVWLDTLTVIPRLAIACAQGALYLLCYYLGWESALYHSAYEKLKERIVCSEEQKQDKLALLQKVFESQAFLAMHLRVSIENNNPQGHLIHLIDDEDNTKIIRPGAYCRALYGSAWQKKHAYALGNIVESDLFDNIAYAVRDGISHNGYVFTEIADFKGAPFTLA
ncbi:MAG: hypothetical protein AAGF04_03010 [Chlamydiota bacterium]